MTRKILLFLTLCISGLFTVSAQNNESAVIKPLTVSIDDYMPILEAAGYSVFPFDISSLNDGKYMISFIAKEYIDGKETIDDIFLGYATYPNMHLLSDFPEDSLKDINPEEIEDPEKGIYTMAKKLTIGFSPVVNDSIRPMILKIDGITTSNFELGMKPIFTHNDTVNGQKSYMYVLRPFKLPSVSTSAANAGETNGKSAQFKDGEFIPLVLFGSGWYDPQFDIHRFCGEREIDPDFSSRILKYIPHYYVIGVKFTLEKPLQ